MVIVEAGRCGSLSTADLRGWESAWPAGTVGVALGLHCGEVFNVLFLEGTEAGRVLALLTDSLQDELGLPDQLVVGPEHRGLYVVAEDRRLEERSVLL